MFVKRVSDMRRKIVIAQLCAAVVILAVQGKVAGQQEPTGTEAASAHAAPKPYTATYRITVVRKLADGSTITRQSIETVARDSVGRRMDLTAEVPMPGAPAPMTHIRVDDQVARSISLWGVTAKEATVIAMAAPGEQPSARPFLERLLRQLRAPRQSIRISGYRQSREFKRSGARIRHAPRNS